MRYSRRELLKLGLGAVPLTYFLANRTYRIVVDAYGPDSDLARKFYERSLAGSGSFASRSATRVATAMTA